MEYGSNGVLEGEFILLLQQSIAPSLFRFCSSNTEAASPLFEKRAERRQIILSGLQRDRIDIIAPERAGKFRIVLADKVQKGTTRFAISCINLDLFPGLGILQGNDPYIRQHFFSFIVNMDGDEIVPPPTHGERSRKVGRLKIRYEKNDRAPCHDLVQVIKCQHRLGAASVRSEK